MSRGNEGNEERTEPYRRYAGGWWRERSVRSLFVRLSPSFPFTIPASLRSLQSLREANGMTEGMT